MSLLRSILTPLSPGRQSSAASHHSSKSSSSSVVVEFEQDAPGSGSGSLADPRDIRHVPAQPATRSVMGSQLASLARHEANLQRYLQRLLDAQSAGLLAGLGDKQDEQNEQASGDNVDNGTSPWSSTSTLRPVSETGPARSSIVLAIPQREASALSRNRGGKQAIPVRQPRARRPSLCAARREIQRAMLALSATKQEEDSLLQQSLGEKRAAIEHATALETRRAGLHHEVEQISAAPLEGDSLRALRQDSASLAEQINAMEAQLAELKSRQRSAVRELETRENAAKARLSSYRGSLALLDKDIEMFLRQPPPEARRLDFYQHQHSPAAQAQTQGHSRPQTHTTRSVWDLPDSRRTLALAIEEMERDAGALAEQHQRAAEEMQALDDGARVWDSIVKQVTWFERALRAALQRQTVQPDPLALDPREPDPRELQEQLDGVIEQLEEAYNLAEQSGWNLLICSIGAELDALRQGRDIIRDAFGSGSAGLTDIESDKSSRASNTTNLVPSHTGFNGADGTDLPTQSLRSLQLHSQDRKQELDRTQDQDQDQDQDEMERLTQTQSQKLRSTSSSSRKAGLTGTSASKFRLKDDDEPDPDLLVSAAHDTDDTD